MPEREGLLNASHVDVDQRHLEVHDLLQAYIYDGNKTESSLHVRNLFSPRSSVAGTVKSSSTRRSSRRSSCSHMSKSDRLSEARVQAELAKSNLEQYRMLQEANQKKLAAEREASRQQMEFERLEAQRKLELDRAATQRKLQLEQQRLEFERQSQLREEELKQANIRRKQLEMETERRRQELEEELELQRQLKEYEQRKREVSIREREEMRSVLGSDYESKMMSRRWMSRVQKL